MDNSFPPHSGLDFSYILSQWFLVFFFQPMPLLGFYRSLASALPGWSCVHLPSSPLSVGHVILEAQLQKAPEMELGPGLYFRCAVLHHQNHFSRVMWSQVDQLSITSATTASLWHLADVPRGRSWVVVACGAPNYSCPQWYQCVMGWPEGWPY